jgi:hypothetical protein
MAEVIEPRAFNQRFTLHLNSEGKPVERSLREMMAGEVWKAIRFQIGESNRLEAEAMPWQPAEGESEEAYRERMSGQPDLGAIVALLRRAAQASFRAADLMERVQTLMPQWRGKSGIGLQQALQRWWPGGR